jgi:pre-mRNA cleavage complex 2 protein Pcf11
MKNLRGQYLELINTRMVAIFCHCFEKLTEPKVRISLYKLRQTWNPFIAKKRLAAIDKHVHALDPNWPVTATDATAPTSPTIHVNPEFLLAGDKKGLAATTSSSAPHNSVAVTVTTTPRTNCKPTSLANKTTVPSTLEQRRRHVLETQKKKREQLKAIVSSDSSKPASSGSTVSVSAKSSLLV